MKLRTIAASAVVGAALVPASAMAEGLDYTYVDVGYVTSTVDVAGIDVDGDGLGLRGSFALTDAFQLVGSYTTQDFDGGLDVSTLEAGVGWRTNMSETVDFVSNVRLINAEAEVLGLTVDDDGYGVGVGVRGMFEKSFEWEAGIDFTDVSDTNTAFHLDGRYYFTPMFSGGAGLVLDDDSTTWRLGVRADFQGM